MLPRCNREFPRDFGKGRPCLNAHIGKCMAVCSGKISCEAYNEAVQGALRMIRYGKKDIVKQLREKMEAASERLDFETAALLRDQIQAIERVSAGQKVVMDADTEMDVIALAGTTRAVCAAVLRYRDGRLTDKREFVFHDTTDIERVREEFLPQYYLDGETIPKIIAVDKLPPDGEALNEALNQTRGSKVELYVPQRGDVAKLVTMAYTNAVERLGRESGRYTREEKLLEEAAQMLGLKSPPRVIESYDISNWGDGSSVCGMVVFKDGKPHRSGYRRFKMKTVAGTDDYASLAETLSRRAAEYEAARRGEKPDGPQNQFATLPDLLLIDGGRGQVGAVKQALKGTAFEHVPTFGMVKDDHHRTRAIVDDVGGEIAINRNRNIFTFVTNIQGRDPPLRQRLPQAGHEKAVLCGHADGPARRGGEDQRGSAGPLQDSGRSEGGQHLRSGGSEGHQPRQSGKAVQRPAQWGIIGTADGLVSAAETTHRGAIYAHSHDFSHAAHRSTVRLGACPPGRVAYGPRRSSARSGAGCGGLDLGLLHLL